MLRVEFHEKDGVLTMRIEGRFVGRFAEDFRDLISRRKLTSAFVVDLSQVSFVDETGEEVLSWLGRLGAVFQAESAYSCDVCERLHLPLVVQSHLDRYPHRSNGLFCAENPLPN